MTILISDIAIYTDEVSDNFDEACKVISSLKVSNVVLRQYNGINICNVNQRQLPGIRDTLKKYNLKVACLATQLGKDQTVIDEAFALSVYFESRLVRFYHSKQPHWYKSIVEAAIAFNLTPILELEYTNNLEPTEVVQLLLEHKRVKLLFDPAQFIIIKNQNPFIRYYVLLQKWVECIDIRDFKIGHGFKPAGFGDSRLSDLLKQSASCKWLFLEPSLGKVLGSATGKENTFKIAWEAFLELADKS